MILARRVWGHAYSNVNEVVNYVASLMPIVATSNLLDGVQCVLSGALSSQKWYLISTKESDDNLADSL